MAFSNLNRDGFAVIEEVTGSAVVRRLLEAVGTEEAGSLRTKRAGLHAIRNLLRCSAVRELADSAEARRLIDPVLGASARAVRGILFDKTPGANWKVAWHQDLSIAVAEKVETAGYGPWSVKAGVVHVQPPTAVLENMLTIRLHLDDCGEENGPLLVLPGSHVGGVLSSQQIEAMRETIAPVACTCRAGGVVLMRPLLLHASSEAKSPGHRRVVHIEYAGVSLPAPLKWAAED